MPLKYRVLLLAIVVLAARGGLLAGPATQPAQVAPRSGQAQPDKGIGQYLRFVEQPAPRLETAEVVFVNYQGTVVRLVSAVHIAEASYFKSLDESFRKRDAVLYELVKPRDADLPQPGAPPRPGNPIGDLQRFLKDSLDLEFQLDQIDYSQANFVHADLDVETFEKMQAERGESFATLMLQQLMRALSQPELQPDVQNMDQAMEDVVKLFTRPDMERQIKTFIARQIGQMEEHALGLDGPGGTVILTERNKAAVKVLENVLKDGKKDIAIFYGAAHMPDLAERLQAMGFKPVATEWRMAWDLTIRPDEPSAVEKLLMDLLKGADEDNGR